MLGRIEVRATYQSWMIRHPIECGKCRGTCMWLLLPVQNMHRWYNGIIPHCHCGDSGSIPDPCANNKSYDMGNMV